MTTRRCPRCGSEYLATVGRCADCGVDLVDAGSSGAPDARDAVDPDVGVLEGRVSLDRATGRVSYALDDWAGEVRVMIGQLLASAGIPFLWEAGTLVTTSDFRVQADELILQAEAVSGSVFADDTETSVYELDGWPDEQVNRLSEALTSVRIPFEFDIDGNLVIAAIDDDRIEDVFDELELDDAVDPDFDGASESLDVQAALSELFVATDRLRRSARDHEGVLGLLDVAGSIEDTTIPFGFTPVVWNDIVSQTRDLRTAIEDDSMTDGEIEAHAARLRNLLHEYV